MLEKGYATDTAAATGVEGDGGQLAYRAEWGLVWTWMATSFQLPWSFSY